MINYSELTLLRGIRAPITYILQFNKSLFTLAIITGTPRLPKKFMRLKGYCLLFASGYPCTFRVNIECEYMCRVCMYECAYVSYVLSCADEFCEDICNDGIATI